jgi:hypothetical protein
MPVFTIETTYWIPVWRLRTYEAATVEEGCRLAVADDDWSDAKEDHEAASGTYVSGIWQGHDCAYNASPVPIPSQFDETLRRKSDHFETLLGILKLLAARQGDPSIDLTFWRERAKAAIAKAEAILSGEADPD